MTTDANDKNALAATVQDLLHAHWREEYGFSVPNPGTYPHLWLWDSCFHAIIWSHLNDARAVRELEAVLEGQLPGGMIPHMRYGAEGPDTWLGPLEKTSSLTQPPMFGHAVRVLTDNGTTLSERTLARAKSGLDWLWNHRRTEDGLIYVVHPWETGNDHSPRWDDWGAPGRTALDYDRSARTAWNKELMHAAEFAEDGAAIWSSRLVSCPAGFNAYTAFNMFELAAVTNDADLADRARQLAESIDGLLWNAEQDLWSDLAIVGGGPSVHTPISDGIMGALVSADEEKSRAALSQLHDPARFGAEFGPSNVARTDPAYDPAMYWRGAAWPQMNYLLYLAQKRWGLAEDASQLAALTARGASASRWAEYWNPETGEGLGAMPQTWTGLAVAMR